MTPITLTRACNEMAILQGQASDQAMTAHRLRLNAAANPGRADIKQAAEFHTYQAAAVDDYLTHCKGVFAGLLMLQDAANDEPVPFDGDVA